MEKWKEVEGYEGLYEISNLKRVKSLKRQVKNLNGFRTVNERILATKIHSCGYVQVVLRKYGTDKCFRIHVLVAKAFIPNSDNKPQVNHIYGVKLNNIVHNLEWVTRKENMQHASQSGLLNNTVLAENRRKILENHKRVVSQFLKDGLFLKNFNSIKEAAEICDIPAPNIVDVCAGRRKSAGGFVWKYV